VFATDLPSSETADRRVLIGTQGFADLNLIAPDYIVPNQFLATDGGALDYAGVDLVGTAEGATVIEVNGNPSWRGILEATGLDMAEVIAEHVLGRALRRRRSSDQIVLERSTGAIHG
jgi:hypothetical protein